VRGKGRPKKNAPQDPVKLTYHPEAEAELVGAARFESQPEGLDSS